MAGQREELENGVHEESAVRIRVGRNGTTGNGVLFGGHTACLPALTSWVFSKS